MKICILGGDSRNSFLSEELTAEGIRNDLIAHGGAPGDIGTLGGYDLVIGPVPFSRDNETLYTPMAEGRILIKDFIPRIRATATLMSGSIDPGLEKPFRHIDLTKNEFLYAANIPATIEGILQILLGETSFTLHGAGVLLLGFGRVGRPLAFLLENLGAKLTVYDRRINPADGRDGPHFAESLDDLSGHEIIVNTIPEVVLHKGNLPTIKKDVLILDVASFPGGVDRVCLEGKNIRYISASGIPGKRAPKTVAVNMKKVVMEYIQGRAKGY